MKRQALLAGAAAVGLACGSAVPVSAAPTDAHISEISYPSNDADFVEIAAPAGTDLSGWTVGSVTRGGALNSDESIVTLPKGTVVGESGVHVVELPLTNSVNTGAAADGAYGASVFVVSAEGKLIDFKQIGGVVGGTGVTASKSSKLPAAVRGQQAEPTGAKASGRDQSIQLKCSSWESGTPTPGSAPDSSTCDSPDSPEPTETSSPDPTDPSDPENPANLLPINTIQGNGEKSPYAGKTVTTTGVVTAAYPTGGLGGYYIQTEGTGGDNHDFAKGSHGVFVYSKDTVGQVKTGDNVEVTGSVSEYYGQTQITVDDKGLKKLDAAAAAPKPYEGAFPEDPAEREALEGMLVQPSGDITVTDNYSTNVYGEIGLANGTDTLRQPTDVARPGSEEAQRIDAENKRKAYTLDDGGTADFFKTAKDTPLPYLSNDKPVRVGAKVTFTKPTVVGYSHDKYRLQPTGFLPDNDELTPASFENTRTGVPDVSGDMTLASFNVLNYFPTTGDTEPGCRAYTDREGNPVGANRCKPRGAYNQENFERQQTKIVAAINKLDASVVALEEVESSDKFGKERDWALSQLVKALNAAAGEDRWAFVPSPQTIPETGDDVIRTAFIYQRAEAKPVGDSAILDSPAFHNARAPLAQKFQAVGVDNPEASEFIAVMNHFKSKGSGKGPGNEDTGDGQGNSNADRVAQAKAVDAFAEEQKKSMGTKRVFILGDLNSYTKEDPMQVFYDAGYTEVGDHFGATPTYLFGGLTGSLDHVLASKEAMGTTTRARSAVPAAPAGAVTGAATWNINSVESIALEYSRHNYNVTNLYQPDEFRSSDHDPLIVGISTGETPADEPSREPSEEPSEQPSEDPNREPSEEPNEQPSEDPSQEPSEDSSDKPTAGGSGAPSEAPADDSTDSSPVAEAEDNDDAAGSGGSDSQAPAAGNTGKPSSGGPGSAMPRTGTELTALGVGLALLAAGAATVLISRRRSQAQR
ncbi:ExeM/NucH family extracellular endonuclease [Brevibacterium sp. HMSC063G07]|uniref:ExeM/NucH family extracellular endonuclease n=1 Tax=Brevibacterium sp. HMSC063G07 TaxID=1739261 RepID=UPI0008A35FFE|nr:ExeM/NucH family extracellular endonuclease [Brevibacterium sp. HMSC063G07]OFL66043.1 endonuclease/exonuclease/phosphatase [Brevibacterium sp. HMSC063G07]